MPQYAAVLGHQPHISIAELAATVSGFESHGVVHKQVLLFSADSEIDSDTYAMLGGTVMLAERVTKADVAMSDVPQILATEVSSVKKKVTFGLRCFGVPNNDIKTAYRKGKDVLKTQGRACRYIGNDRKPAHAAAVLDADIISGKKGVELFIVRTPNELWVGKTIGVQDINEYTWLDMEKPVRDTTVGLLPPKLAQMMLNFGAWIARENLPEDVKKKNAQRKRKKKEVYTVLDPFCGTGVIPLECLLRGWNVLASDAAQKAVNGCKKNLEWVRKERKILKKDVSEDIAKHDATKAFSFKQLPDMVVTETSLGPSISKAISKTDANKHCKENEKLQLEFLRNAANTLPGVPLVCTWPFWRVKGETIRLEKPWSALADLGYEAVLPDGIEQEDAEKPSLLYQRKDQFVGREIVILQPIQE